MNEGGGREAFPEPSQDVETGSPRSPEMISVEEIDEDSDGDSDDESEEEVY